jgi:hypothetical protein
VSKGLQAFLFCHTKVQSPVFSLGVLLVIGVTSRLCHLSEVFSVTVPSVTKEKKDSSKYATQHCRE